MATNYGFSLFTWDRKGIGKYEFYLFFSLLSYNHLIINFVIKPRASPVISIRRILMQNLIRVIGVCDCSFFKIHVPDPEFEIPDIFCQLRIFI